MIYDNNDRADRAKKGLVTYAGADDDEALIRDLLCDLRHLADRTGVDWNDQLRVAMDNYRAELVEDGTDADREKAKDSLTPLTQASQNLIDQLSSLRSNMDFLPLDNDMADIAAQLDELDTTAEEIHSIHVQEAL